jgi:signal transduction histidine kinase
MSDRALGAGHLAKVEAEQAALRRIAALLARSVPAEEVFDAVVDEVRSLMGVEAAGLARYEADKTATVLAVSAEADAQVVLTGDELSTEGRNVTALVLRTGRPARVDDFTQASGGELVRRMREAGVRSVVGAPIQVRERLWGLLGVYSMQRRLPPDTEGRLADFAALVASAIANVQAWSELEASRVRIISAADEARRRVSRDLHDGAQQRIVALALTTRMLAQSDAAQTAGLDAELRKLGVELDEALEELRTIASGLHPAALSRGGLAPALRTLARRSPIPVELDVRVPGGIAESVEVAAYYVIAETLTNTTKHAEASRIDLTVERRDDRLRVSVRDDGVGGADPACGSGLEGLKDRIEAFGGTLTLDSPPGAGTTLIAQFPLTGNVVPGAECPPSEGRFESRMSEQTLATGHLAKVEAEQAALRRIAALLARSVPAEEVFDAVVSEVRLLMGVDTAGLVRYEADETATILAVSADADAQTAFPGEKMFTEGHNVSGLVLRTGRPARIDDYTKATGGEHIRRYREAGVRSVVGAPIQVRERLWGLLSVAMHRRLPPDTEGRLADFAALVASAIANVQAWSELEASRVRIISAADEARRRVSRDLHDGAQQRIVALALTTRMLAQSDAAQTAGLDAELRKLGVELDEALEELRTIASGLHPAALSRGGLAPALRTLARRSPIPVELDVRVPGGIAESVEVAAYYVIAETLTNTTKHAEASRIDLTVERRDDRLRVSVRDDGVGGADPACGSGLEGLKDRIEAFGGTLTLDSPPGAGTTLIAQFPLTENPALEASSANA